MDLIFTHQEEREPIRITNHSLKLCLPLVKRSGSDCFNPFLTLSYWVSKSAQKLCHRARFSTRFCCRGMEYKGMVVNNSTFCTSPVLLEEVAMETVEKCDGFGNAHKVFDEKSGVGESGSGDSSSDLLSSEATGHEGQSHEEESSSSSSTLMGWPLHRTAPEEGNFDDRELETQVSPVSETEMMKERFSKLLLGEDMSGCGNGVCTALAISNAITNLCATLFGQLWRLEPLAPQRKAMWRREMELLLCVSNHIVELIPISQTFPDGSKLEVMTSRPRSDLYVSLPALRKLDHMLLDILESFVDSEFWYVDQGILAADADGSSSFRKVLKRQEDKWWLPIPRVPSGSGLSEASRRQLQHKRDCTNQILKAAIAINSLTLDDMDVPTSYLEALPKNGRASLGEAIYRYISSDEFSPVYLLECLDISSEHQAIEIANRVEAAMYAWRKATTSKPTNNSNSSRSTSKSSWEMLKELVVDADKSQLFAERAESVLFCLKQQFPNLPQTSLDMSKIQFNKDVGKAILESYSRVLESLAFNVVARIDDLLYVDDLTKHSDQIPGIPQLGIVAHNSSNRIQFPVPFSSSPYRATFMKPNFSAMDLVSLAKGGTRSPIPISSQECGILVKNVSIDKGNLIEKLDLVGDIVEELEKSKLCKGQDY